MSNKQDFDLDAYKAEGDALFEEHKRKREELLSKYPNYQDAKPIKVLNLIMKKQFAEAIIRGEKKVEVRSYSSHYVDRLLDKDVCDFMALHENEDVIDVCQPLRDVLTIHFHNYNNSWSLDVECEFNNLIAVNDDTVSYYQEEYGCHEFDEELARLKAIRSKKEPLYFTFVLGKVLKRENI